MTKLKVHTMEGYSQRTPSTATGKLEEVAHQLKEIADELNQSERPNRKNGRFTNGHIPSRNNLAMNGNGTMKHTAHMPQLEVTVARKGGHPQKLSLRGDLITLGRGETSDIVLDAQAISRDHAHIKRIGNEWHIVDLGSTNGTNLSGRKLTPYVSTKWHPLMQLRVGPFFINQRVEQTLLEAPAPRMPKAVARPAAPAVIPDTQVLQDQTKIAPAPPAPPKTKTETGFMAPTKQKQKLNIPQGRGTLLFEYPPEIIDAMRQLINRVAKTGQFPEKLALTSALREEGVTYISRALGATIANDLEASVCVVELNWWHPSGLPPQADFGGLAGVLARRLPVEKALLRTNNPKLFLLPAGTMAAANRSIASRSTGLRQVIQYLSDHFDYIILDIPAVLTTNDSSPLASIAEACCLIVNQGATPIEDVKSALDELNHLPMMGTVMNKMRYSTPKRLLKLIS